LGFAPGAEASSHAPEELPAYSALVDPGFAIGDFDGDTRLDVVKVQSVLSHGLGTRYRLTFQLSSGPQQTLCLRAPTGGLQLTSRDVNGDHFVDVVVTTAWTNQPIAVLLNDGRGNFSPSNPATFPGAFSASRDFLASTTDEITEATPALLSRQLFAQYKQRYGISTPHDLTAACVSSPSRGWLFYAIESIRNRPPPPTIHLF